MEVIISVIENQPGETIERHIHHGEEAFYILQGATLETADGKLITLPAGASAINRRDVPHAGLKVLGNTPFKYLERSISWTRVPSCTTRHRNNNQRSPRQSACLRPCLFQCPGPSSYGFVLSGGGNEATRFH